MNVLIIWQSGMPPACAYVSDLPEPQLLEVGQKIAGDLNAKETGFGLAYVATVLPNWQLPA